MIIPVIYANIGQHQERIQVLTKPDTPPECFGALDEVFPLGPDALRSISPACRQCGRLKACLKAAVDSPAGVEMRAERMRAMDRRSGGGLRRFVSRWSELKLMRRNQAKGLSLRRKK